MILNAKLMKASLHRYGLNVNFVS